MKLVNVEGLKSVLEYSCDQSKEGDKWLEWFNNTIDGEPDMLLNIRSRIEAEKEGYPPSADEYKMVDKILGILDEYAKERVTDIVEVHVSRDGTLYVSTDLYSKVKRVLVEDGKHATVYYSDGIGVSE